MLSNPLYRTLGFSGAIYGVNGAGKWKKEWDMQFACC
jgi:hypothetical protein